MEIESYLATMYAPPGDLLRTGDVIGLRLDDFKTFVKYNQILTLLEQFENDHQFPQHLWAVLNQPCNMVHDEKAARYFQHNLFLCPLMGLKTALRKGAFGDLVHVTEIRRPETVFSESFKTFIFDKARTENTIKKDEEKSDYNKRIASIANPSIDFFESALEPVTDQFALPDQVLNTLKTYASADQSLLDLLNEFEASETWGKSKQRYQKACNEAEEKNENLILKRDAAEPLARLANNQLDAQGVFFYEPNNTISKKEYDLAHVIFLQDMLTIKISSDAQKNGNLVNLLKKNRILSLTENFSDRLLNIMGNYFSKIGTGDVMSDKVIELYTSVYSDTFFVTEDDFKKRKK